MIKNIFVSIIMLMACITTEAANGSFDFTYVQDNNISFTGTETLTTYNLAIFIPGEYAGKTVEDVYLYVYDKSVLKNMYVWASASLPESATKADNRTAVPTAQLNNYNVGDSHVMLNSPYTIPEEGCYVGYSFTVTSISATGGKYPIAYNSTAGTTNGFWLKTSDTGSTWRDHSSDEGMGNLALWVTLTGDFPDLGLTPRSSFGTVYGAKNSTVDAPVTITNSGTSPISNISYKVMDADNTVSEEKTVTITNPLAFNETAEVTIPLTTAASCGTQTKTIVFTKINGTAIDEVSSTGTLATLSRIANRKILEEEFTGHTCGNCPRGIVGMQLAQQQLPDNWVGVALHFYSPSDPMYPTTYSVSSPYYEQFQSLENVADPFTGAPSCRLNRGKETDPFYGNEKNGFAIVNDCKKLLREAPCASIAMKAEWQNDATAIKISSEQTFFLNEQNSHYAVGYYIIADSMHYSSWKQANYLYSYEASSLPDELADWASGGQYGKSSVSGLYFSHVALAGIGVDKGISGSVTSPIVEDVTQTYETTVDLSQNKFFLDIQYPDALNKQCVKVIGIIIDTNTGSVVNAEECDVTEPGQNMYIRDISVSSTDSQNEIFTLDGIRHQTLQKGLNIIHTSDGKSIKLVKP